MQRLYPSGWPGNMRAVLYLNAKKVFESVAAVVVRLLFNGVDQYFTHAAWSPSGVNFDVAITYTPAAGDIGAGKTLIAGLLAKNASDQLVVTYTDVNAVVNALTLTALTLAADTEYDIVITSDGNGVELSAGGETVIDADIVDPSTLSVDTWFSDTTLLQGGDFVDFDGVTHYANVSPITLDNFTCTVYVERFSTGDRNRFFGGSNTGFSWLGSTIRFTDSSGVNHEASGQTGVVGQIYKVDLVCSGTDADFYIDGELVHSDPYDGLPISISRLAATTTALTNNGPLIVRLTDTDTGDTYEYFTADSVTDNGDGTGNAANTGNTGSSFDATVQNFTTGDLVALPSTRANGIPSDLSLNDQTRLQGGEFFEFNGTSHSATVADISSSDYVVEIHFKVDKSNSLQAFISSGSDTNFIRLRPLEDRISYRHNNSAQNIDLGIALVDGDNHVVAFDFVGTTVKLYMDGRLQETITNSAWSTAFSFNTLGSLGPGGQRAKGFFCVKFTDRQSGNTYEYFTANSVADNLNGTATAANTGNTGSAFDATVQNFTPSDLVALPNKTHAWPMDQDQASQPDTVGSNNGTIVNYDGSMQQ